MAPLNVEVFPASDLPLRTQTNIKGSTRKGFRGDLKACELFSMLQYKCEVEEPVTRGSVTKCFPVERLFRRCKDGQKSFMVETTAWEKTDTAEKEKGT
ncbi:uncharacterized protein RAG0_09811 [Rhynchosporium agropyri]|uniref:Mitochondrial export protein Som1 n=1 Tax=Rhynchosporium agropyri TaxID=914238 RepID=A0A1E1KX46_9HELO|nr:uncharacterized protein RAG0_09811 [Rhynchosporium agropyri]